MEETISTNFSVSYVEDIPGPEKNQFMAFKIFFGITFVIGLLTSIPMVAFPVLFRHLKSPFFIMLASWSLANMLDLAIVAPSNFTFGHNWKFGEFWCHGFFYLWFSLSFIRPYLMVATTLLTALGNRRFQQMTGERDWLQVFLSCLLSSLIWILILLPCIWYWFVVEFIEYSSRWGDVQYDCVTRGSQLVMLSLQLVFGYILPILLTVIFLLVWACRRNRTKIVDTTENMQAMVLFGLLHVHVLSQALFVTISSLYIVSEGHYEVAFNLHHASMFIQVADLAISPSLCLVVVVVYRRLLKQSRDGYATEGEEMIEVKEGRSLT